MENHGVESRSATARSNTIALTSLNPNFTVRAVIAGLFIGVLINLSNTYYGLRIGASSQMPMISGSLGFALFEALSKLGFRKLASRENVLLISVATAVGCMPPTAGFVGAIPALEFLLDESENGPIEIAFKNLLVWTVGLCFFGIVFAYLFRESFIEKTDLPWPGPVATSHLIRTLHRKPVEDAPGASGDARASRRRSSPGSDPDPDPSDAVVTGGRGLVQVNQNRAEASSRVDGLLKGSVLSLLVTVLMYFLPILRQLPVFGTRAADDWLWYVDLSPGFLGQGMIIGPAISLHILFGSIVGWALLSPYVKSKGWASGKVDDWTDGPRGWIIWISLAALFADALTKLSWLLIRPLWMDRSRQRWIATFTNTLAGRYWSHWASGVPDRGGYEPVGTYNSGEHLEDRSIHHRDGHVSSIFEPAPAVEGHDFKGRIATRTLLWAFLVTVLICTVAVHVVFGNLVPWFYTILAIVLALPMALVGVRSLAETDYNPESALVSQLVFAAITPLSNINATAVNLVSAAIAQAGANQAGDIAYDLKVGYIIGAQPDAQMVGHVIGSIFGTVVSCGVYRLYTSQYSMPSQFFQIPSSYLVLSTARLLLGRGLPEGVAPFVWATAVLSVLATVLKIRYSDRWWQCFIPSGVAFAMGVYLLPSLAIARVIGASAIWIVGRRAGRGRAEGLIVVASGLILGESVGGLVNMAMTALGVPQYGA